MHGYRGEGRARADEPEADASLRARTAAADAAFVADGLALGLPLEWAVQPPLADDWTPRIVAGDRPAAPAPRDARPAVRPPHRAGRLAGAATGHLRPVLSVVARQATGRPAWPTTGSHWRT